MALIAVTTATPAQDREWTGLNSDDWFEAGNWEPQAVPGENQQVDIDSVDPHPAVVDGKATADLSTLRIGVAGDGELTIRNGGSVDSEDGRIGEETNARGTVTVTGTGSAWTLDSLANLLVGVDGSGTLRILDGGSVSNGFAGRVGAENHSEGTVTVSGPGSTWEIFELDIGPRFGSGNLTIETGGSVSSNQAFIARTADSLGTVTVTGAGSVWNNSNELTVGRNGDGTLTIADGGSVSSATGFIGRRVATGPDSTTDGKVNVTGEGSTWTSTSALFVATGDGGLGALTIAEGGSVSNPSAIIGVDSGAQGQVAVIGAGSLWDNSAALTAGDAGSAVLSLQAGGVVRVDDGQGTIEIASQSGGDGSVRIGGGGAAGFLQAAELAGGDGSAELVFDHDEAAYFLTDDGTAAGSPVDITGSTALRHAGPGTTVIHTSQAYSGTTTVAHGILSVDGGGINAPAARIVVGEQPGDDGSLEITGGGMVHNDFGLIADEAGSIGQVTVTDPGSVWDNEDTLIVGNRGTGTLSIEAGASVQADRIVIADRGVSQGAVTVTGTDSTLTLADSLRVGLIGSGTLTIADGAQVSSQRGTIGQEKGSAGTVTVTGADSQWTTGSLSLGGPFGDSAGTLTIADGATVEVATGNVNMAPADDTAGTLNIGTGGAPGILAASGVAGGDGTATVNFNHSDSSYLFTDDGTAGGNPVLITGSTAVNHMGPGTTILTGDHDYSSQTTIDAGTLQVKGTIASHTLVHAGGTLAGNGTVAGNVQVDGTVSPRASAGTLEIAGDLTLQPDAVLAFDLDVPGMVGNGVNDLIEVTGDLVLDGTVNITDLGGFGEGTYTLITYTGALIDHGLAIGELPADFVATIETGDGTVRLVTEALEPEITIAPAATDFGIVAAGQTSAVRTITVTNSGDAELTVSSISPAAAPFAVDEAGTTCPDAGFTLAPDESCDLAYIFAPVADGVFIETITIASDAATSPDSFELRGRTDGLFSDRFEDQ